MLVEFLENISRSDVEQAGGKGANLGELISNGFPIPAGFVVTAEAYRLVLQKIDLEKIDSQQHPETVASFLVDSEFDAELQLAVSNAHEHLQARRDANIIYAVRSSATAEDLGDASFAGQHETYYYVTAAKLDLMIRKCWASLWSEEAVAYRDVQGIEHASVFMAVVVQEMIPSEISGITFTADPLTGSSDVIVSSKA